MVSPFEKVVDVCIVTIDNGNSCAGSHGYPDFTF
jgi:hypothetical protein